MSEPFLGEIRQVSFNFAPKGWAFCNGQLLSISQNTALFSLLGTTYGGDGRTNFALPNYQGRVPIHQGADLNGNSYLLGQSGGEGSHTLLTSELPQHVHSLNAVAATGTTSNPNGASLAEAAANPRYTTLYGPTGTSNATAAAGAIIPAGSSQPHNNLQPLLVVNFVIALQGIFPARN